MEQPRHEWALIWNAGTTGEGLAWLAKATCWAMSPFFFNLNIYFTWKVIIIERVTDTER